MSERERERERTRAKYWLIEFVDWKISKEFGGKKISEKKTNRDNDNRILSKQESIFFCPQAFEGGGIAER